MDIRSVVRGVAGRGELLGSPEVRVAVLDGPVDLAHPCLAGADLTRLPTLVSEPAGTGPMSLHGTHVTSLLFGQPASGMTGLVPRCTGLLLPVFRESPDGRVTRVPQLDLARAVEQAVEAGAHVVNVSGGERTPAGTPNSMLERALRLCADRGVLVVAAVGNDGCDCLQAPAATPSVLAVGAADATGAPLGINNWGGAYRLNGVVAPGRDIRGAAPGGGFASLTGSSFAAPAVTGVVALLVARQLATGHAADPIAAGRAVLESALRPPCDPDDAPECRRLLRGLLNAPGAFALVDGDGAPAPVAAGASPAGPRERVIVMDTNAVHPQVAQPPDPLPADARTAPAAVPQEAPAAPVGAEAVAAPWGEEPAAAWPAPVSPAPEAPAPPPPPPSYPPAGYGPPQGASPAGAVPTAMPAAPVTPAAPVAPVAPVAPATVVSPPPAPAAPGVCPSCAGCGGTCGGAGGHPSGSVGHAPSAVPAPGKPLIYAIGTIGFDFQTEARRDSFRQLMPYVPTDAASGQPERETQPNIYDPQQLHAYLSKNPWASDKLTWTLNMDATPIYALEAEMPVGMDWTRPIISDPKATPETVEKLAVGAAQQSGEKSDDGGTPGLLAQILETLAYPPVSRVYRTFRDALLGQAKNKSDDGYISRVSIPGILTDRTVRLFSGEVLPVVEVKSRGLYTWNETLLVNAVYAAVVARRVRDARRQAAEDSKKQNLTQDASDAAERAAEARVRDEFADRKGEWLKTTIRALLDKIYWKFRNLGRSSADRALNAAGTNAFMVGAEIQDGILSAGQVPGVSDNFYSLDTVSVAPSPFCRTGSDCQDVVLTFFDPENDRRAPVSYLFTYDVSDEVPVSLAPVHTFIGGM
ncbi:S8 family serine peptidase [Streptomyces sp. R302]|uniref:cyanobactin maturation protease PatG family protein n=1 Tax=unclassified Streptomyces TaxID=2593676 RepID=UPI00145F7A56|nr:MULTISPECIES: S8 family serine peptidase [unclassified Streptomyces]NML51386.1 S8 family serine peptidase [Streptomyces sp. R301]NML79964.1 S8 family serine peptidase [Streptomyces sp. R302]